VGEGVGGGPSASVAWPRRTPASLSSVAESTGTEGAPAPGSGAQFGQGSPAGSDGGASQKPAAMAPDATSAERGAGAGGNQVVPAQIAAGSVHDERSTKAQVEDATQIAS
jgi:hypothetical protein